MEELKRKLNFRNTSVQTQGLWRLYLDMVKKKPHDSLIDGTTPELPELTLVLECICSDEEMLAQMASQIIVQLVQDDLLEFTFGMNSLLNSVPSCKTLAAVVRAVYGLLALQAVAELKRNLSYTCPYALRSPPHPLMSVLTNRPESWPYLVEEAGALYRHGDERIAGTATELLRPFLLFIFVEPAQSSQFNDARAAIVRVLFDACRTCPDTVASDLCRFFISVLPKLQIETREHVTKICHLVEDMSSVICDKLPTPTQHGNDEKGPYKDSTDVNWPSLAGCVLTAGLEIVLRCLRVGASSGQLTEKLIALTQAQRVDKPNRALLLLSTVLATSSLSYHPRLFTLAHLVVEACPNWSNRLCLASLVKPVLQFLTLPNNNLCYGKSKNLATLKAKAGQLLVEIEEKLKHATTTDKVEEISRASYCLSTTGYNCQLASELCQKLVAPACKSPDLTQSAWLNNVSTSLDKPESCTLVLNHLISAILIGTSSTDVLQSALAAMTKLARLEPVQAPDFLPVILYVLGKSQNPEVKLQLLEAIPQLATHKFCIPPVLKTIQALSRSEDLKAVSIRLLVLLWKQQDRCFPQLLQAISDPHPVKTVSPVNLILLAKASAILDICKYKPEQHGAQLLAPLSDLLSAATSAADTAVSVLALEGLYLLCEAEVIDIQSLWAVLGEQCTQEKRPLVVARICRLLSLVPRLKVKTDEYEVFTQAALVILWMHSQSSLAEVRSAAFHALSQFSASQFCVSHLPKSVTTELYQQTDLVAKQQAEAGDDTVVSVDQVFPQVPGSCYVDILKTISDEDSIKGYTKFLQTLAHSEAANLPRSVFFSSLRRHGSTQDKSVEMIPNFLLQQYDKCKQPGLRPGLAAGLLFCYDPPLEVGRDGRPRKHYVLRHGKTFLEMFGTLLQEVPVQPSDWHRCALMPQAWSSFMVRLFLSLLESRKADLELQEKHGHISASDLEEKKVIAWLSTRDSILDVIKASSRGTPAAQANSVMSLAGLALCLHKFVTDMEPAQVKAAEGRPEFLCHSHWQAVTYQTILSLADGQYTPVGNLHGLCQQRTSHDRPPPSSLCSAMARLAASQVAQIFASTETEKVISLLNTFASHLSSGPKPLDSPIMALCNSLALGSLLGRLFEEHFSEMTGSKGMLAVWKSLAALEEIVLDAKAENRTGCILGLGLAICGLCAEGKIESKVHAKNILEKLEPVWLKTAVDDATYAPLSFAVSCIASSLCACNSYSEESALNIVHKLQQAHQGNPQNSGICLALGLMMYTLCKLGMLSAVQPRRDTITAWVKDVSDQALAPLEKVAKLTGLLASIGSEQSFITVQGISLLQSNDVSVKEVTNQVTKIVSEHSDLGIQSVGAWMLGHLHLSASSLGESKSSVPTSYSYLPDWSIIRALFDFLVEAGRSVPDNCLIQQVEAALQAIKVQSSLPAVNWAAMLTPFMRINYGEEVKILSLQVAVRQMQSSPNAALFMSSWLAPSFFSSLQPPTKAAVHVCLPDLIKTVSPSVLKLHLERNCLPAFIDNQDRLVRLALLKGLKKALAVVDPPQAVTLILYEFTAQLYALLPNEFDVPVLNLISDCLSEVPDEVMDSIIVADFSDASTQVKGSFVRCHLVATGRQSLSLLNHMIDASFNTDYWDQGFGMLLLTHCLVNFSKHKGEYSRLQTREQWFLELLGHTRTVVTGAMPLAETAPPMQTVINYIGTIVTSAVLSLTYPHYHMLELWGVCTDLFESCVDNLVSTSEVDTQEGEKEKSLPALDSLYCNMVKFLPAVISVVASKPWDGTASKVLDWCLTLLKQKDITADDKSSIYASLLMLRHGQEFRPASLWTTAVLLHV